MAKRKSIASKAEAAGAGGRKRKGYSRRADIPKDVLERLNRGEEETITLVEWLAVDLPVLAETVLMEAGEGALAKAVAERARGEVDAGLGVMGRIRGVARAAHELAGPARRRERVFKAFAGHRADVARQWGAYMVAERGELDLEERLELMRAFAADGHMGVREIAWAALRPYVAKELERGLELLEGWTRDGDANVRRCAVEGTRPRGVWCEHLEELKKDPERALGLLENVKADPARYVQLSVGNWLNDASKTRPEWVTKLGKRWLKETKGTEGEAFAVFIVNRGMRTERKKKALGKRH